MNKEKLNLFVKKLVEKNKKEELNVLWSFVFSGCNTGFKNFTNEAKEHFAKIFKQSLEMKYNESDPFRIIDNITKPIEMELDGLDVKDIDNDRIIVIHALLSSEADKILIDELKEKIKNLKENDKEILDIIFAFIHVNKSDNINNIIDKFYYNQSLDNVNYIEVNINAIREFLIKFKNINKTYNELINIFVYNGFILSPYISSSSSPSENIIIPLFILNVYVNEFLQTNLIKDIENWQEKVKEETKIAEQEEKTEKQKIECDGWTKKPREQEEAQKDVENKLNSYISELIKNKDFVSIDIISTLAFNSTTKSYVDINHNRDRAEEFRKWLLKLAIENIKIKHSKEKREAKEKTNETVDNFFDTFPDFLSYEYYDYNISALHDILKSLLEVEKENEIKNRLKSFNEREKKAISFLIEYIKSELSESLDGKIVTLKSDDMELGKCNQIINQIFIEENYGKNKPFERCFYEVVTFLKTKQIKTNEYPRFEIGDIAVRSGFGFWCPYITNSSTTGFGIKLTFPTWLLTKSWENLPKITNFEQKIIEVKSQEKSPKFSDTIKKEFDFDNMSPQDFERNLIPTLFKKMGYECKVTSYSSDYGTDIIAEKDEKRIAIQAKKWKKNNNVPRKDIGDSLGSALSTYKADKLIVITTSDFSPAAKKQANDAPIPVELWNGLKLNEKIKKHLSET